MHFTLAASAKFASFLSGALMLSLKRCTCNKETEYSVIIRLGLDAIHSECSYFPFQYFCSEETAGNDNSKQ